MKKLLLLTSLTLMSCVSLKTYATDSSFEVTPFVGYRFGGDFDHKEEETTNSIDLDEATSFGAILAWPYEGKRQGELLISHYDTELSFNDNVQPSSSEGELGVTYFHLGGNVPISTGAVPFWLSGGLGVTHISPDSSELDDETKFSVNLGLHTRVEVSDSIALKFGARMYGTFFNSDSKVFCDSDLCAIYVSSEVWVQSELSAGVVFKF